MSTSNELIIGIVIYLFSLIFYNRFHRLFLFISSFLILFSILNLDINSYSSDLQRYSDLNFISTNLNYINDFLFYRISLFIYKIFANEKAMVLFWQLLIFFNLIYSEKLVLDITKRYKIKYVGGLFLYTIFISVGFQTIYNQLRYGIAFSIFIVILLFLIKFNYTKKRKYVYYSILLLLTAFGIHQIASTVFVLIPLSLFCLNRVNFLKKINLFKTKIFNMPLSILFFIGFLFSFYLFNLKLIQEAIPYLPILANIADFGAQYSYLNMPLGNYIFSFLYAFLHIFISYRAVYNLHAFKYIEILKIMLFISILSTSFLLVPLGSRLTSLCIFLPFPFYISFNKISLSYFLKSYYILITLVNLFRIINLFPSIV